MHGEQPRRVFSTSFGLLLMVGLLGCGDAVPSPETPVAEAGAAVAAARADSDHWPQWRGPTRDGRVAGPLPSTLPDALELVWRKAVGGGYSSPVSHGGRVFVHERVAPATHEEDETEGERVGRERLRALSLEDGTELWSSEPVEAPFSQNEYATSQGAGPFSTPAVDVARDLVYSLGVNAVLEGRDTGSGALRCRYTPPRPDTSKLFTGTSVSPLILEDGPVVVHVGDDRGGRLMAYDCSAQETRWIWEGDGPGYASPMLFETAGIRQIVTLTDRSLVGVQDGTGELLWRVDFADEWNENIVTPTLADGTVLVSGVRRGALAVQPARDDAGWSASVVWQRPERTHYMSSPVLVERGGSSIWVGLSNKRKGQLVALDPSTGDDMWEGEGRFADSAALVAVGDDLLALTVDGELVVLRPHQDPDTDRFALAEVARYTVAEEAVWPHLAVVGDILLVRSAGNLRAWRWPGSR